jgi:hypothetical protein
VSNVVCVFTGFAMLKDRSRSSLVKIGFESMKLKATKSMNMMMARSFLINFKF